MSDMIPFNAGMVPDYIRSEGQSELTKDLMQKMGGTNKRISIRGKVFRLIVNGEEVAKKKDALDVVIVNVAKDVSRTYYAGTYDPTADAAPPTCWSADSKAPHPSVENPQHSNCNDCPMNIAGSGQGTTRACRFKQRIAVVLADDLDSGVHMLELPATSLFGKGDIAHMPYQQYFKYVASQNHSIDRLITRISFDDDADTPKMFFSPIGFPSREAMPKLIEFGQSPEAKLAVTLTVYQADKGQKALPSLKDAIKANGGEVDEDEEPKVKAKKPADVVPAKPDVSAVLAKFANKKRATEVDDE
jgi:hypothetical protein